MNMILTIGNNIRFFLLMIVVKSILTMINLVKRMFNITEEK